MAASLLFSFPPPPHLTQSALHTRLNPKLSFSTPPKLSNTPSRVALHGSSQLCLLPSSPAEPDDGSHHREAQGIVENVHLVSLCRDGRFQEARKFLRSMEAHRVSIKTYIFQHLFEACGAWGSITDGKMFHEIIKTRLGREPDGFLGACLVKMYCECSSLGDARNVFDGMTVKSPTAWRNLVIGYAQSGSVLEAICLISEMMASGVTPDRHLIVMVVSGLTESMDLELAKQVHSFIIKIELETHVSWKTALVNMYLKSGCLQSAVSLFDRMEKTDAVTWTSLMVGYAKQEKFEDVLTLFQKMLCRDVDNDPFLFSIVLKACTVLGYLETGKQVHGLIVKVGMDSHVSAGTPIVHLYVKCGCIMDARVAFERISEPNEYSWSALFSVYYQMRQFEEVFGMFKRLRNREMARNSFIYTGLFQVCAVLADHTSGSQLHGDALKRGLVSELKGKDALVTMYWKSGDLGHARRVFNSMNKRDTLAWTAMIAGYTYHGYASEALHLFYEMQHSDMKPDPLTLTAVLTACSHSGLVLESKKCLGDMKKVFGFDPTVDHYNCMVDIYCRAGQLDEAFYLIKSCTFPPDTLTWKILLRGCINHLNLEIGKIAIENLLQNTDPQDADSYDLSFNLYVATKRVEEAAFIRKIMNDRSIHEDIGCCWLAIKGKLQRVDVDDGNHPRREEVYSKLEELGKRAAKLGSVPFVDREPSGAHDERKDQFINHSEKLAVALGLVSMPSSSPVTIFKNLRICGNCHSFIKFVSSITTREIIVRDSSQFHHFKNGTCSCKDYW